MAFCILGLAILKVFGFASTITVQSPNKAISSAVATQVKAGHITSSPGFKSKDTMSICIESVTLVH
jgi:hypothetical protein